MPETDKPPSLSPGLKPLPQRISWAASRRLRAHSLVAASGVPLCRSLVKAACSLGKGRWAAVAACKTCCRDKHCQRRTGFYASTQRSRRDIRHAHRHSVNRVPRARVKHARAYPPPAERGFADARNSDGEVHRKNMPRHVAAGSRARRTPGAVIIRPAALRVFRGHGASFAAHANAISKLCASSNNER